jgi:hypothetical protein
VEPYGLKNPLLGVVGALKAALLRRCRRKGWADCANSKTRTAIMHAAAMALALGWLCAGYVSAMRWR